MSSSTRQERPTGDEVIKSWEQMANEQIRAALEELTAACESEFGDDPSEPDDSGVMMGEDAKELRAVMRKRTRHNVRQARKRALEAQKEKD